MSGIVKNYESLIGGASGGNADTHTKGSGADIQIFTTTGSDRTWVKPAGITTVYMEVIGGGGGGGGISSVTGGAAGAGGGGGGAFARQLFSAESVDNTLTVVVGTQTGTAPEDTNGSNGNESYVKNSSNQ